MSKHDPINSPSHYTQGSIQPIEAIEAWKLNFNLGNAVKYIARAGKKDPSKLVEDLSKGRWYLNREIASHAIPDDESSETIMETIQRISMATGYDDADVMSTALWLFQEVIQAKFDGKHAGIALSSDALAVEWHGLFDGDDGEAEEEESEPLPDDFVPNEETLQAIKDVDAGIGVERHENAAGVIAESNEESIAEPDPSKTIACYRCAKCGMPVVHGTESKDSVGGVTARYHFGCFPAEAKPDKPKFAVGDKVLDACGSSPTYGFVKSVKPSDDRPVYTVEWTEQVDSETNRFTDEHWESELKPFEAEKPKFKVGDKVRVKSTGDVAVAYEVQECEKGGQRFAVVFLRNGDRGSLTTNEVILLED